jgi:hypothetical protein
MYCRTVPCDAVRHRLGSILTLAARCRTTRRDTNFHRSCYDFLNIFADKFSEKIAFLTQNKAKFCKKIIITLIFKTNANFFAENWENSQKIVIITSAPGL